MRSAAFLSLLCLWLALPAGAGADEPSFTARLSAEEIALNQTVELVIEVERDATTPYQGYSRPELADFDILHQGQSESMRMTLMGGRQSVRTSEQHVYLLKPKHRGKCSIPSATLRVGGRELKTQPLAVHVLPPIAQSSATTSPSQPTPPSAPTLPGLPPSLGSLFPPAPNAMRGDEDIFVEAHLNQATVYLGEPVVVSWWLYTQADVLRYRMIVEPKHDDFWSEDLYTPPGTLSWDRTEIKGRPYLAAMLLKRALYPLKAGRLVVSRLDAEATTLQSAFYPGGSAVRSSRPLVIEVLPLPAAGRPDDFEVTNVGQFQITASLDRDQVVAGDALTLKVIVRGEGNIRNLKLGKIERIDGFRVYEPAISERIDRGDTIRGERVFTYLLLPERGGDLTIAPIGLSFFDPKQKKYDHIQTAPIVVHVTGDPQKLGSVSIEESKENVLGPKLKPLRIRHHVSSRIGERILRGPLIIVLLAVPPGILLIVLIGDALRTILAKETVGRKRRRAQAAARARLHAAEGHIKVHRPSSFFAECARAIYEHLEYRLGEKCESLMLAELRQVLEQRGFGQQFTNKIVAELENCDFARFASTASKPSEMRAATKRVRALLLAIEKVKLSENKAST